MPPRPQRKQKSTAEKNEEAERQKRILSSKEKILSTKRMILSIVEVMIERDVSKKWFLANCTKLCHADYDDVIQERSIELLCGYPVCNNNIKQTLGQKFHISRATNKVYDLTERKCFCSNQCYKASNYLKAQLSPIPLYMRKDEKIKVHFLSDCDNRGSAGEEVVFHLKISEDDIDKVQEEERLSNNIKNILKEDIKKCADSLGDLKIKENVFEKPFVFEETPDKFNKPALNDKNESNSEEEEVDSDESADENLFPSYDNITVLTDKHMPIPEKIKKTVLIPPQKLDSKFRPSIQQFSLDFIVKVFEDWMTEDSAKYLLGEKYVFEVKAEHLFKRMTADDPLKSEKLESIKKEYINLCLKIDSLPDDNGDFGDSLEFCLNGSRSNPKSEKESVGNSSTEKVYRRRPMKKSNEKGKRVTFSQEARVDCELPMERNMERVANDKIEEAKVETEEKDDGEINQTYTKDRELDESIQETSTEDSPREPAFPLVDSVSQNILRRQAVISKLKSVYTNILPVAGLHYTTVRKPVRQFVDTLSLTPTNITFKPKEWKLISVVLLRVLTRTVLKDIWDEVQFLRLCEDRSMPIAIDTRQLEEIVQHIISVENILNLQ